MKALAVVALLLLWVVGMSLLCGWLVPRRIVRRQQETITMQQVTIGQLTAELHREQRINAALARGLFKPATPSPTTRLPGPQDVPIEEWVRSGRS